MIGKGEPEKRVAAEKKETLRCAVAPLGEGTPRDVRSADGKLIFNFSSHSFFKR